MTVEGDPPTSVEELTAVADAGLAGLGHRRLEFDLGDVGESLRAELEAHGWQAERLVWMRHEAAWPPPHPHSHPHSHPPHLRAEPVDYDAAEDLRLAWHEEASADPDRAEYLPQARDIALRLGVQTFAIQAGGLPVGFVELAQRGTGAEITSVYVHRAHRGRGFGTELIRSAAQAAGDVRDLWICADDEARPKHLYGRLGFRPVRTGMEFLRLADRPTHRPPAT